MSYLIQTDEISLANQERLRQQAVRAGKERALAMGVATPGREDRYSTLIERPADYIVDVITPSTPALVAGLDGWLSMPLAAVGTDYSIFANSTPAAVAPVVPDNQVIVFYKVTVLTIAGPDPVSMLLFSTGTAVIRKAQFDLEALYGKLSTDGYLTKPVVYDPREIITATVRARVATAAGCRVRLGTFVIEPIQVTIV